ncbi:MAG: thiamine pyrophosphate enzyme-like binding region [Solirubrobacterales bacterium]|nr:thiamine pyrophosphate enzyme-like binding region [Solirubrobacterales bacterium]
MSGVLISEAVGKALADHGVEVVFGLMGSGNLAVTNALRDAGATFYAARHEGGAICMADGYGRVSGKVAVCSVHQGPGLTNAVSGLTEAAKSRTPVVLLSADTPAAALRSNFRIDQDALVESVGAVAERVHGAATALDDVARAVRRARVERRAVVLMLPLDVQAMEAPDAASLAPAAPELAAPRPTDAVIGRVAGVLASARRPAIIGGRGAVLGCAREPLRRLGELTGALLATSAVGNGLFAGDPFDVGISGGFSSPLAARLLGEADVVVAFGATLNQWTTRHGALIGPGAQVIQVDLDEEAIGAHRFVDLGVVGDTAATAQALVAELEARGVRNSGVRTEALARQIRTHRWRDEPYEESGADGVLDPRTLSIALDDLLPAERTVVVDSGHFMGYPSMYLRVPDAAGFVFPQAFQCVGLGLGNAIGAAVARPDRLTVAALGDGGALMALSEFETLGRLGLPMLVVVYNDAAYGADVHHFRALGQSVDLAQFPDTDFAAIARGAGCGGVTVRSAGELGAVRAWLAERDGPLVIDAKVDPNICAEWLEEAFRGH